MNDNLEKWIALQGEVRGKSVAEIADVTEIIINLTLDLREIFDSME